ncbi:MAG: hypothetical protein BMS9Abin12_1330 [Acidimicrobiia bacterium]|nr:MAG: hypothetical protein BMS9Abin12_1330 [Acidimicrobiia bacterium]
MTITQDMPPEMTPGTDLGDVQGAGSDRRGASVSRRRRLLRAGILVFFVFYVILTLLPFYFLFVRTFVSTKDSAELWFWLPPEEEVNMDAEIGNLSIFLNLDIAKVKEAWGIPATKYVNPRQSLTKVAEKYDIPEETIKNYLRSFGRYNGWIVLLGNSGFWSSLARTVLVAGVAIIGTNLLGLMTGAGLAGLRFQYQRWIYAIYLLEVVIPTFLILLPQFILVSRIQALIPGVANPGLVRDASQLGALILLFIKGGALSTMIFTSAIGAIPRELEESAEIDGATRWQYIRHILLPLMKVPIAGLTVIVLPFYWNSFLYPFIYLDPGNATLQPFIASFTGQYTTNFRVVYTGVFVSIIPLVLIYFVFRKWFISGVLEGAVKG